MSTTTKAQIKTDVSIIKPNQLSPIDKAANTALNRLVETDSTMQKLCLFVQSNYFPSIKSIQQAFVVCEFGKALGLDIINSLKYIYIQDVKEKGVIVRRDVKVQMPAIAAMIDKHPKYSFDVMDSTEQRCKVLIRKEGKVVAEGTYTIEEAQNKGLTERPAWQANKRAMLFYRALYRAGKIGCPEIFLFGLSGTGETVSIDEEELKEIQGGGVVNVEEEPEELELLTKEEIQARGEKAAEDLHGPVNKKQEKPEPPPDLLSISAWKDMVKQADEVGMSEKTLIGYCLKFLKKERPEELTTKDADFILNKMLPEWDAKQPPEKHTKKFKIKFGGDVETQ